MSDGTANLTLNVKVNAQIEAALAKIRELSIAARTDTSAPTSQRAKAISDEIAMMRALRDEQERTERGGILSPAPQRGAAGYATRQKANADIRAIRQERLEGLDQDIIDQVMKSVGTPGRQRVYAAQNLGITAGDSASLARAVTTPENAKIARDARAETARLNAAAADEAFTKTLLDLDVATKNFWSTMEALRATSIEYSEAMVAGTVSQRQLNADIMAAASSEQAYIESTVLLANTRRRLQQETVLSMAGVKTTGLTPQQLQDQAAEQTRRLRIADTTRQLRSVSPDEIQDRAQLRAAQASVAAATREEALMTAGYTRDKARSRIALQQEDIAVRDEIRTRVLAGTEGGEGTRYQRLTALASPSARLPQEGPTIGQSLLTKGLTSAQYALGGLASGALIFGIIDAVKEATKLQASLAGLKGQLEAIGRGDDFGQMRDGIKAISNETGIASTEVTRFASRLAGLFSDPQRALEETRSAMELAVVSGTDMNTLLEELVPTARAYGISVEQIGDAAVTLHDKFGIAEEDMLQFFGATAAAAKAAGFTFQQLGPIGAAAANSVGVSLNVAGEQFNKVVETIRNNADKVFSVYQRRPETANLGKPIVEALGRGEGGEAFKLILASYDKLDAAQQQNLIRVSGSRREWALLSGLLSRSDELLGNIIESENGSSDSAGSLDKRFREVSATIQQTNERLRDLIRNLVEGLVSSGIGGALNFILLSFEKILGVGSLLLNLFSALNDKLKFGPFDDGLLAFLVQIGAGIFLASRAWAAYTAVKAAHGRINALVTATERQLGVAATETTAAEAAEAEAVAANAATKEANVVVTTNMAGETVLLTTVTGGATTAEEANTGAVLTNTGAKEANAVITTNMAGQTIVTGGSTAVGTGVGAVGGNVVGSGLSAGEGAVAGSGFVALGKALFGPIANVAKSLWAKLPFTAAAAEGAAGGAAATGGGVLSGAGAAAFTPAGVGVLTAGGIVATNWARDQALHGGLSLPKLPVVGNVLPGGLELQKQADDLHAQIQKESTDQVMKMAEDHRDWWTRGLDRIQEAFFDIDLPVEAYQKEANLRTGEAGRRTTTAMGRTGKFKEFSEKISDANLKNLDTFVKQAGAGDFAKAHGLVNAGGDPEVTRANLEKAMPGIEQAAEAGDDAANQFLAGVDNIVSTQQTLGDLRKVLDSAMAKNDTAGKTAKEAVDAAGGMDAYLNKQYDPKGALDIGQITPAEFAASIDQDIATKRTLLATSQDPEADYKALNAKIREGETFRDQYIQRRIDALNKTTEAETPNPKAIELERALKALPTRSRTEQFNQLPVLQDLARQKFNEMLAAIQDPVERYRAATEGMNIDPRIQQLDLEDQIRNVLPTEVLGALGKTPEAREKIMQDITAEAVKTGATVNEILLKKLEERRSFMVWLPGVDLTGIDAAIAALKAAPDISTPGKVTEDPKKAERKLEEDMLKQTESEIALARAAPGAQGRKRQAQLNLQSAQARLASVTKQFQIGGEGAPTQADVNNAQAAVTDALRASDDITRDTANAMMEWDVINAYGDPLKQNTLRLRNANKKAQDALARAGGDTKDPDYIKALQEARQQQIALVGSQHEQALAQMDWAEINAGDDPVAANKAKLDKARVALQFAIDDAQGNMNATPVIRAAQDVRRLELEMVKAEGEAATSRYSVLLALAERDPLKTAILNQAAAAEALERVRGTAAEQQALADKIRADHGVEDAMSAIFASRAELAGALAEVAGDPVKAAEIAMQEAKRKLDEAVAQGRGEAEVNQLRGQYATASENAAHAARTEEESIIDFQLQMRQITTQQAIEGLKLILSRTKYGTDEYRQLALKIDQLEQQAGQDLQFNLPSNISLPTLYEARRLNQGAAAGIGYMDNRNIALTFQVNGAQDPAAVSAQIMSALQGAMGGGQLYTPGVAAGAFN